MRKTLNFMNGYQKLWKMNRSYLVSIPLCLLALMPTTVSAQKIDEMSLPSLELIEFLGAFEDDDAGWIDPFELLVMDTRELENLPTEEDYNGK